MECENDKEIIFLRKENSKVNLVFGCKYFFFPLWLKDK